MMRLRQIRLGVGLWLALVCCLLIGVAHVNAAYGENVLKKGMRGEEVRQLQQNLYDLGYPLGVDGIFGNETEAAVKQFQGDEGLTVDGIVGPQTFAALAAALERLNGATQEESAGGSTDGDAGDADRYGNTASRGGNRDAAPSGEEESAEGETPEGESAEEADEAENDVLDKLYEFAEAYLGTPYRYGGTGKDGIDCSALTQLAMQALGYDIPRRSADQATVGIPVERDELKAGDLVFFNTSGSGISHVAIYLEDNLLLNASVSKGVTYTSLLENYWDKRYHSARRIIGQ